MMVLLPNKQSSTLGQKHANLILLYITTNFEHRLLLYDLTFKHDFSCACSTFHHVSVLLMSVFWQDGKIRSYKLRTKFKNYTRTCDYTEGESLLSLI